MKNRILRLGAEPVLERRRGSARPGGQVAEGIVFEMGRQHGGSASVAVDGFAHVAVSGGGWVVADGRADVKNGKQAADSARTLGGSGEVQTPQGDLGKTRPTPLGDPVPAVVKVIGGRGRGSDGLRALGPGARDGRMDYLIERYGSGEEFVLP